MLIMLKGNCLCGRISYVYYAELEQSILCFCQDCRRAQGALFGWNSPIYRMEFEFISGVEYLKEYFHTPNKARVFCGECASPIYSYRIDLPDVLRLRLGTVVEGVIPAPNEKFYSEYKPYFIHIKI